MPNSIKTAVAILHVKETTKYPIQHAELLYNEKITSNNLAYGGIHPLVALESHRKHLSGLVQKALYFLPPARNDVLNSHELLLSNGLRVEKPNAVAVTRGPGMRSSLMAGLDTAKGLAVAWNVPLIGVHHMQAHALTPRLCAALEQYTSPKEQNVGLQPAFPFLTLLISGGHTLLLHSTGIANHSILANTDDIAIGDCLDKCARSILPQSLLDSSKDVSYGRLLESFAFPIPGPHAYDETALSRGRGVRAFQSPYGWQLPVPLLATRGGQKSKSMKFSYTGLVTFATRVAEKGWVDGRLCKQPRKVPMPEQEARYLAREVMRIAFEHLASRVSLQIERERVAHEITPTTPISNALVISGGVAANQYLRHVFQSQPSLAHLEIIIPPIDLCTDNAAMIAWAAHEMLPLLHPRMDKMPGRHQSWEPQQGQLEMDVLRKWSLENILHPETELDARDRIGDAASALGRDPSASEDTSLANQESHQFERRCVSSLPR
ncbi:putative o-sialoglycoprotein endopeptidase [Venturia nashicola]|nr:putative o-sialoglycoprotein endopeptidase [Venturia nashicola]